MALSAPVLLVGELNAEERINWLKSPAQSTTTPLQAPPPLPVPPSLPPQSFRYRLGPGDQLVTSVFKIEGYEAQVQVLGDGTINLPRLGTVEVWGLTLEEARQRITDGYRQFLRRPLVYLDLVKPRPVRVTVTGQVLRPGVFTLPVDSQGSVDSSGDPTAVGSDGGGWPSMVEVIQKAGGISATGDLGHLELLRPSPIPGGPTQSYVFDYLTVLKNGGFAPNPLIYDGDSIRVRKSTSPINVDLLTTAASNFAPAAINVQVVGEVFSPGVVQVGSNAPLSSAILASGGVTRRGSVKRVDLIRVDRQGRSMVKQLRYDPHAVLSSANNPPLRNGDVVVVDRNTFTKVTDTMTDAMLPFEPIVDAVSVYRLLGLPAPTSVGR
ncbi:sugar ABC transporter substrate-binding protein [Synechococcus sp. KORDI-52]|nr:sugar ABC transporter substrate-binding protein [Synechococcus sp. KORDI-52]